jgi:hypothetical protein
MTFSAPPPNEHGPFGPGVTQMGAPISHGHGPAAYGYGAPRGTAPGYGPLGVSIPPAPPGGPKRRANLALVLGLGGGAVALLAVLGGVAYAVAARKPVALPVDAKLLPPQTNEIATQLIEATRETDEAVKSAYLSAELGAQLCRPGTYDPARRLESIGSSGSRAAKELFFDKEKLEGIASLLACGSYLGASLDSPYQAAVSFEENEQRRLVSVAHFRFSTLPSQMGFSSQSYRSVPGYCQLGSARKEPFGAAGGVGALGGAPRPAGFGAPVVPPGAATSCEDADHGAFAQGTTWFLGRKTALETMAHAVMHPKEELNTRLASLQEAAKQTEGLPVVRLQANPKSSREFFLSPCYMGASQSGAPFKDFMDGCFPGKSLDGTLSEIDAKIKAAAYETDGDVQKAGAFHGNIVFVARDDDTAKEVEREVKEVVSEWKAHLEQHDAKLINQSRDLAFTSRQKKFSAIADRYFKALSRAEVKRKGRSIRVTFLEKLGPEDKTALEDADKSTVEKRRAVAQVLLAIETRTPLPEAALGKLVGLPWAKYLVGPPPAQGQVGQRVVLSTDECKKLQSRVAWFSAQDRAFDAPGARAMLMDHKYAACATRPMIIDAAQRPCLDGFRTAPEYAACATTAANAVPFGEPPEGEFGVRAGRR